jgi:hypothetical protein
MEIGDCIYDSEFDVYGIVEDVSDIHNIFVKYLDDRGTGLYCTDLECNEYDSSLKIIKNG